MSETEKPKSSFETLAAINVGAKIEKKNGLSYLSWAWALDTLMRADPNAHWDYPEPKMYGETMMVYCTVTAFDKQRTAHLPVMDYRNKPIPNPDAFAVNTAMQRCLVKAIALHGLGLYIYAGEDLPYDESANDDGNAKAAPKKDQPKPAIDRTTPLAKKLLDCGTASALQAVWEPLDKETKLAYAALKDECKQNIIKAQDAERAAA